MLTIRSEAVIYYRADPHNANRITSAVDYRDRPFILGATVELPRDYASLTDSPSRKQWKTDATLMTIDEAFKAAYPGSYDEFIRQSQDLNVSAALRIANKLEPAFYFSAEAARNVAGYYFFRGCVEASIARSTLAGKLVDVLWPNAGSYDIDIMEEYAKGVLAVFPNKWLGYNVTGEFPTDGESPHRGSQTCISGYSQRRVARRRSQRPQQALGKKWLLLAVHASRHVYRHCGHGERNRQRNGPGRDVLLPHQGLKAGIRGRWRRLGRMVVQEARDHHRQDL